MSEFTVRGSFQSRGGHQDFEKTVEAESESAALDHVYASFGSEHGLRRTQVEIEEVDA